MAFILIYVTHENQNQAKKVVDHLIQKKLIECTNFLPITSCYWWQENIQNSDEVVPLLKTKKENWEKVKKKIKKIHPYDTPCIMKINVEINEEYENWINKSLS